jgi:hypothetical protein
MYHHVKKLMYTVNIAEPDARFVNMLLEQFGGANEERGRSDAVHRPGMYFVRGRR